MHEIGILMEKLAKKEGFNETQIPGVKIYKSSQSWDRIPLSYDQGMIFVGQGAKRIYLGDEVYEFNPDNYLVLSVPLPAECECLTPKNKPMLALSVNLDVGILNRILCLMDTHVDHTLLKPKEQKKGLFIERSTPQTRDTVLRLLQILQSSVDSSVLGSGVIQELMYRVMRGEGASSMYALAMKNSNLSRIDKALRFIHSSYQNPIDVDKLAALANMSPSAFHRTFKDVTSSSPIQYVKKVRLNKAKELLIERGERVNVAASEVGYTSATQFSREFKRHFGSSPTSCVAAHEIA